MLNPDHPGDTCPEFWKNNTTFRIREIADTAGSSSDPIPQSVAKCRRIQDGTSPDVAMVAAASVNTRDKSDAVSDEGQDIDHLVVKYTQLIPKFEFVAKVPPTWFHMSASERDEHMRVKNPDLWAVYRKVIQQSNRYDEIKYNRLKYVLSIPSLRDPEPDEVDETLVAPTKIEVVTRQSGPLEPDLLNTGYVPPPVQTVDDDDEVMPPPPPRRIDGDTMANGEGDDVDASWEMPQRADEEDVDMASSIATVASVTLPASAESASAVSGDVPRTADPAEAGENNP